MSTVTVEIDPFWVKIVSSPIYFLLSALQGVSVTFAALYLYWSGQGKFSGYEWFTVPLCAAVICLVPLVYFRLGHPVIKELRKHREQDVAGFSQQ